MTHTAAPQQVDTILHCRWIIPVVPSATVLQDCSLVIAAGKILALLPQAEASRRFSAKDTLQLDRHIVIPGLVNSHNHAAMSLFKGMADDLPLQDWLEHHIWPAEKQWISPRFVADGTELAAAEMIRSGTTTFSDMYFYPEEVARVAMHAGLRCQLAFPVLDFPTPWGTGPDDYLHKGLALHDKFRSHSTISVGFGPHAPYTVSDEPLQRIATIAEEMQAAIQIHLHETAAEIDNALAQTGERPIQRLQRLGLLSPLTQCVHMTQLDAADIELLANSGAHVIHCPSSNLKLASGFCPVQDLLDAGVNVALGTDSAASNNDQDLLAEMNLAALLAKGVSARADAVDAHTALRMATLNGARALGLEQQIGSLEVGKQADITAIEVNETRNMPLYNPASLLAYSNISNQVSHVWVNGRNLLKQGQLQTLNETGIRANASYWQQRIGKPQAPRA
ncbi:TRZ/ATZ family hydrolase [Pseudomaricurvus alcaniphilus]|uniref:TRZ/ATZ family hydrolase n=1 Tax=Pseudomaricurvus alcaniphilus TaxID=1166482 RepID=UPI00140B5107|nr:TRZ/ATZ family hydrolase [Pseudomaricurvus alcaniphilus]NHN36618.1 TRZ/ATZ family hydrolase [Pseudomaricurvus alcaniphilus]